MRGNSERHSYRPRGFSVTSILLYMLLFTLVLTGCKKDPRVEFIQGIWYYKDAHLANIPGESAQETDWEFNSWSFQVNTCCFYEAYYSGYFRVLESKDDGLTLELYNLKGQFADTVLSRDDTLTIIVKIDQAADTIRISGDGPYTRVTP
jgi:hypothetical protein